MSKYLIEYQLEDQAPEHGVFEVGDQEFIHEPVEEFLKIQFSEEGLDEEEINNLLESLIVLDCRKV